MLFQEFFPRLRDQAWERYGEIVTERQFKDWREDGLLPGPTAPKGRGRGRSPARHWPTASYRRALRICRYKFWGARRQSQWWLGFWLSGETVTPDRIRHSLKRELSIERRRNRSFIESNRWLTKRFETIADAERGGIAGDSEISDILALMQITPDQYRRLSILHLNEFADSETEKLFNEIAPRSFNIDPGLDAEPIADIYAEMEADIDREEITRAWRPGHLAEGAERPGKYLDQLPDSDLNVSLQILRSRERSTVLTYGLIWLLGVPSRQQIVVHFLNWKAGRANALELRISHLIRIPFEINADCRDGYGSSWRLEGTINSELELTTILRENASEFRPNLLKFIANSKVNHEA